MSEQWAIGQIIQGQYEIFDIKNGGMGIVFICYDKVEREMIVLKTFHDRFLSDNRVINRFIQEATIWIHLDCHPHIVRAYSVNNIYYRPYIFLEYIVGDFHYGLDLADHLARRYLTLKTILDFAGQFCDGMVYLQNKMQSLGKQFVHADIKPANILIQNGNSIKISDFGLSRAFDHAETTGGWGTFPYMSPEQYTKSPLDIRSDIYSFGCVLYEMVAGVRPFLVVKRSDLERVSLLYREKHFQEIPIHPQERREDCPAGLDDVIMKCLEKNPDNRFHDFTELQTALDTLPGQLTVGKKLQISANYSSLDTREMIQKAISLSDLERYQDALDCLAKLPNGVADPDMKWMIHCSRGGVLDEMGRVAAALGELESAIQMFPERPLPYNLRANLHNDRGEYETALSDYDRLLTIDDRFAIGFYNRGLCYLRLERFEKALADFSCAIELGHYEAYTNRGSAQQKLGRYEAALTDFNSALALNSRNSIALMNIGTINEELGDRQTAIDYYTKAIQIAPFYLIPYIKRAGLLASKGDYKAAVADYEKALGIDHAQIPKDASIDYSLSKSELDSLQALILHDCGIACLRLGNLHGARKYLQDFLERAHPDYSDKIEAVRQVIARLLQETGL